MSDPQRRSSLLEDLAMVAASQKLIEMESDINEDSDFDKGVEDMRLVSAELGELVKNLMVMMTTTRPQSCL